MKNKSHPQFYEVMVELDALEKKYDDLVAYAQYAGARIPEMGDEVREAFTQWESRVEDLYPDEVAKLNGPLVRPHGFVLGVLAGIRFPLHALIYERGRDPNGELIVIDRLAEALDEFPEVQPSPERVMMRTQPPSTSRTDDAVRSKYSPSRLVDLLGELVEGADKARSLVWYFRSRKDDDLEANDGDPADILLEQTLIELRCPEETELMKLDDGQFEYGYQCGLLAAFRFALTAFRGDKDEDGKPADWLAKAKESFPDLAAQSAVLLPDVSGEMK